MQDNQINLVDKMFEFNLWANTQMIELCSKLSDEQLAVEVEAVFGRIQPTIAHIISAEGNYLNRVTGTRPWTGDVNWGALSMSELKGMAQLSGERLIEIASKANLATRHETEWQGDMYPFYNWTVLAQAFYHGVEHRTQIKILLTKLGVEHSDFSVWDYMDSL